MIDAIFGTLVRKCLDVENVIIYAEKNEEKKKNKERKYNYMYIKEKKSG